MRSHRALFAVLALPFLLWLPASGSPHATVPPPGKTLIVIGQDSVTEDEYVAETGHVPGGFMAYSFLDRAPERFADDLQATGEHASKYPGAAIQVGLTMGPSTFWSATTGSAQLPGAVQVTGGAYDTQLGLLADWLNQTDATVYLRIGFEFDLLGGQWGAAEQYKAAYRYIVDRLRAANVTNALYVWHSAGAFFRTLDYSGDVGLVGTLDRTGGGMDPVIDALLAGHSAYSEASGSESDLQPISDFYPGDGYVDMFGISYWDDACCFGHASEKARAAYRQRTRELLTQAQEMGLPIMIGESTPAYIGVTSGEESLVWFARYFDLIEEFDIRVASMIVWDWTAIDNGYWAQPYWGGFWPDARVHHYEAARTAWLTRLSALRYQ